MSKKTFKSEVENNFIKLTNKFNKITNKTKYLIKIVNDDNDNKIIDVFDDNDKKILSVTYEMLGTYDTKNALFLWAYNKILINKKLTKISKKIKLSYKDIEKLIVLNKYSDMEYLERLYYYTKNNIFYINSEHLNNLIEYCIFVSECKGVLTDIDSNKIQSFYIVTEIISY